VIGMEAEARNKTRPAAKNTVRHQDRHLKRDQVRTIPIAL
jgi:hypothetical protein